MTIVTAPSFDELRQVLDFAETRLDQIANEAENGETSAASDWEIQTVYKMRDWIEALENLDDANQQKLACFALNRQSGAELEIEAMLTISTCHISQTTAKRLEQGERWGLVVYAKGDFGWLVYAACTPAAVTECPPVDLSKCLDYARSFGVSWLCLDSGGGEAEALETYEW